MACLTIEKSAQAEIAALHKKDKASRRAVEELLEYLMIIEDSPVVGVPKMMLQNKIRRSTPVCGGINYQLHSSTSYICVDFFQSQDWERIVVLRAYEIGMILRRA